MNFKWDKKYLHGGITAFLVVVCSVLFFFALFRIDVIGSGIVLVINILKPILYGMVIAYLLTPVNNFFDRHLTKLITKKSKKMTTFKISKLSRVLSIFITMFLSLLVISALINMIIPQLTQSVVGFVDSLPNYLMNAQNMLNQFLRENPRFTEMLGLTAGADIVLNSIDSLRENLDTLYKNFLGFLPSANDLLPSINNILSGVTTGVVGVLNTVKNIGVGIIVSIYLLYSKETFAAQSKKLVYAVFERKHANSFLTTVRHTHKVFSGFIVGKLLDSLIIGILCFIFMTIFGWPLPLLISVIIGVTNIIPFFGPFIGAIPASIIILLIEPMTCIYFVLFILALQQFDGNILGPKILGESTGLSCFWVIFSILVGGGLFGFVGMIVGVPFFAVIYAFIKMFTERVLTTKSLPTDTSDYKDIKLISSDNNVVIPLEKELKNDKV